jgi:peptide-methionine (S)-S-oxide reductase
MEKWFRREFHEEGLVGTRVGYVGGAAPARSYEDVCTGRTGHAEALECTFDPAVLPYERLLDFFWRIHDPTTLNRQGNDIGTQYRSAIFTTSEAQQDAATKSKAEAQKRYWPAAPITTEITPAGTFWPAEEYHQRYLDKHPTGYCNHRPRW